MPISRDLAMLSLGVEETDESNESGSCEDVNTTLADIIRQILTSGIGLGWEQLDAYLSVHTRRSCVAA